ncbi:RHS repeat-associated core domain-containing protein [Empedobacter falsenii]|uniref:RHS repeat-associated core domain-containing protein n=1 Tax=Empedobacter stercoris TaxID=1628248 RepID=UPI001CE1F4FD|nr:RHS repeat-associated core domain-containing protein [Empedobacter stercoris]
MNCYKYKYNGQEFQEELGLNLYDFEARNYDPAIGRWFNIDPLAEFYYEISTYSYVGSNPIIRTDPIGMDWYTVNGEYIYDAELNSKNQSERLKNIDGAKYFGASGTHKVFITNGDKTQTTLSNHSLNSDGSITDLGTGKKLDNGTSFTDALGNKLNATDDKPSINDKLNGSTYNSNDGNTYQLYDNQWIKLSGISVDPNAYRAGSTGYFPTNDRIDLSIKNHQIYSSLRDGIDSEGTAAGLGIEAILTKTLKKPDGRAIALMTLYNMIKGGFERVEAMKKHDTEVKKLEKQNAK